MTNPTEFLRREDWDPAWRIHLRHLLSVNDKYGWSSTAFRRFEWSVENHEEINLLKYVQVHFQKNHWTPALILKILSSVFNHGSGVGACFWKSDDPYCTLNQVLVYPKLSFANRFLRNHENSPMHHPNHEEQVAQLQAELLGFPPRELPINCNETEK